MEASLKTDVIIVGAGPTGLSLACQLIRHGVDFVIVEPREGVTPFSKALGVHARTLEIYEQLGLAEPAVSQGTIAGKVRMLQNGEIRGEIDLSNVGRGLSQYPYMLVLEQSKNERLLYDYMQAHGKHVLWQTSLESFTQDASGVSAQVKDSSGATTVITAKYLVGCDGPHSLVRHTLGLAFEGSTFERLFYVADVKLDWQYSHDALHICLARDSLLAVFPMQGENRYRIVGTFPEGLDKQENEIVFAEIEQRIHAEAGIALEISHVNWFSTYKVHTRHVARFSAGRCFLAGDSAHVHTPAGGQGMNTGIQDAYNLAWKLAFVLKHGAKARMLDTYSDERLANANHLLVTTDRMFQLAANPNWLLIFMRMKVLPRLAKHILKIESVRKRFFPLMSQIGINYRDFSLSAHAGDSSFKVKAGDRLPYFLLDGKSVYTKLHEPKFHLLAFHNAQGNDLPVPGEIAHPHAHLVDYHAIGLEPHLTEIFGADSPFIVLLRPDNYIAFISEDISLKRANAYLDRLCAT